MPNDVAFPPFYRQDTNSNRSQVACKFTLHLAELELKSRAVCLRRLNFILCRKAVNRGSVETLPWDAAMGAAFSGASGLEESPGPLWGPTMHLDNRSVDAELGRGASLTPAGNQLSPWSVRFNYPYLSLKNCKCYCWSHKLSHPLKTSRHFPDSVLSTGRETMLLMSQEPTAIWTPVLYRLCDILKYPICGFLFVSCWQKKKGSWLSGCPPEKERVRANGQNLSLGSWETLGNFLNLSGLLSCCVSSASVSGGKWEVWR